MIVGQVIPTIIRKCIEARERGDDWITAWGTGEQTREFLYVKDTAEGILDSTEHYDSSESVNLGSGEEISIENLIKTIVDLTGFEGDIEWDRSKPDRQSRRKPDVSRARERTTWEATTDLREGLERTIEWYERNPEESDE